ASRRRAEAPGELREVVGSGQAAERLFPLAAVHEVVPVGDHVAERASLLAERHAAVHAATALPPHFLLGHRQIELAGVAHPVAALAALGRHPIPLEKSSRFPHERPRVAYSRSRARRAAPPGMTVSSPRRGWLVPRRRSWRRSARARL